jgi:hypothetical protein
LFSFSFGQDFDQEQIIKNSFVNRLDNAFSYILTILKNRNEDFFKLRNSNLFFFFNGHFTLNKMGQNLIASNEYRSTVLYYFNESSLKDYQDQVGSEDYSEAVKPIMLSQIMLNFEGFEIHKSNYATHFSFHKGLSFFSKMNIKPSQINESKIIKGIRWFFQIFNIVNNVIDFFLASLGFNYNCIIEDLPTIIGIGMLNRIVYIKDPSYGKDIPSLIQLGDRLFWCLGLSIHYQMTDVRLNLGLMNKSSEEKKTKEDYKLSKDYGNFNIYKPILSFFSFIGLKFNFLYTPLKSQLPVMEFILLYNSPFDYMCRFLSNINQSKHRGAVRLLQASPILRAALI